MLTKELITQKNFPRYNVDIEQLLKIRLSRNIIIWNISCDMSFAGQHYHIGKIKRNIVLEL